MSAIGFGVQEPRVWAGRGAWAGRGVQWLAGTKFVGRHYSGVSSYKKNLVADLRLTSTRKYFGFGDANDFVVLDGARVVGRIFLHPQSPPMQSPWFWTITALDTPSLVEKNGCFRGQVEGLPPGIGMAALTACTRWPHGVTKASGHVIRKGPE
jgi:hypothetical protein